ncbi:MAG: tetratricopeptide repeat protein [Salinibacter sp.]|uniref:tetratricopeptide repeat protein n=1 Tax=Salinibacter sp. TaxID=2065818 RepID=UPI0035D49851
MGSDSWDRLKQIVDAFYEEQPDDRAAWLDGKCQGDEDLRREVESLLDADGKDHVPDGEWLMGSLPGDTSGAEHVPAPLADSDAGQQANRRVGPYRLLEEIGVGGMSVVYRAERADGAFKRAVAVKLLQRCLCSDDAEQRFRAERQVLASLDHPGIARLIDGGVTEGGRPYLVMEHVDGAPITEHVSEEDLGLEARLDLLGQVAEAVQAAHRQLVVHRDLKPSNVLVTETEAGDPEVKLLDFGIAKLLGDTLPVTRPETQTGQQPLTLAYASPEQVGGGEISTQTDVYQLGALAYELLAGTRPFDLDDTSLAETERIITEETPPAPSARASPPVQAGEDLDTIVLKALRKEPGRRYSSVEALAEDLQRYQEGRPVEARPATPTYRAKKFLRRNAVAAGVAAAFLAVVVLSAALLVRQRNRAQENAETAEREARKAEAVAGYLTDLLQSAQPDAEAGDTVTAADMLRRGQRRIDQLEGQPAVQARMLQLLGNAYRERAKYSKAAGLLGRSLAIRDSIHGSAHKHVANTIEEIAHLRQKQGRYRKADSLWQAALARHRELFGPRSPKLWEPLNNLGIVAERRGQVERADSLYRAAFKIEQSATDPDSSNLAHSLSNLANMYVRQEKYHRADSLYRMALSIERERYDAPHPSIAATLYSRAWLLERWGRLVKADSLIRQATDIDQRTMGPRHPTVGVDLTLMGEILAGRKRFENARSALRKARSIFQEKLPGDHSRLAWVNEVLGRILTRLGQYQEAEPLLKRSLNIYRDLGKEAAVQVVRTDLARLYDRWGKPEKAATFDTTATARAPG